MKKFMSVLIVFNIILILILLSHPVRSDELRPMDNLGNPIYSAPQLDLMTRRIIGMDTLGNHDYNRQYDLTKEGEIVKIDALGNHDYSAPKYQLLPE
jgi:hypothetical protein